MKFSSLLLSFLIGAILLAPAVLAYQSSGPTGLTGFVTGIVSSVSDFLSKLFTAPNLVVSDAKFSGNDLQVTITNNGKATANFRSDIVDAGIDSGSLAIPLCKSSGNYCVDNPSYAGKPCSKSGGHCTVRGARTGYGQCSCVFRPKAAIQSIKLNTGQSTTIIIENVGAPTTATKYSFKIKGSGNIKEVNTDRTIQPASSIPTTTTTISSGGDQGSGQQGQGQGGGQGNNQGQQGQQGQGATQEQSQGQGERQPMPDLKVSIFQKPVKSTYSDGSEYIDFVFNISNVGDADATSSIKNSASYLLNGLIYGNCVSTIVGGLAAEKTIASTCRVGVNHHNTFDMKVTTDYDNSIAESDETNNEAIWNQITI